MRELEGIEILEDRTATSRCDEGFLRLRRLRLRNRYADGTRSEPYACDVVSRRHVDAVALVLFDRPAGRGVRVALRTGVRPPVLLREDKDLPHDEPAPPLLAEIVAGVLEDGDRGPDGIETRAAREAAEEAGIGLDAGRVEALGGALFPSPGVADEKVFFRVAEADLEDRAAALGDGSVMEEAGEVLLLDLREAIRRCRQGHVPDMKTEVALLRLCDHVGYVPALDRFLADLPEDLRRRAADLPPLL